MDITHKLENLFNIFHHIIVLWLCAEKERKLQFIYFLLYSDIFLLIKKTYFIIKTYNFSEQNFHYNFILFYFFRSILNHPLYPNHYHNMSNKMWIFMKDIRNYCVVEGCEVMWWHGTKEMFVFQLYHVHAYYCLQ